MTDDVVINIELRRAGGPGTDWTGTATLEEVELATAEASSPGEVLEDLSLELDQHETDAILAARRLRDRAQENAGE